MNNLTYYLTGIGGDEENNEGQRGNNKRKNKSSQKRSMKPRARFLKR